MKLLPKNDWIDWIPLLGPIWFMLTIERKEYLNGTTRFKSQWYPLLNGMYFGVTCSLIILKFF